MGQDAFCNQKYFYLNFATLDQIYIVKQGSKGHLATWPIVNHEKIFLLLALSFPTQKNLQ